MSDPKTEIWRAAIVTIEYPASTGGLETVTGKVAVPAHLLWSAEGMAVLFTKLRENHLGSEQECDRSLWEGFHITGIDTSQDLDLMTAAWNTPGPCPRQRSNGYR